MCGIVGFFNFEKNIEFVIKSLEVINYRGLDNSGIYFGENVILKKDFDKVQNQESDFCIGHNLHRIVSNISQPLKSEKGVLVTNAEIYNWKSFDGNFDNDSQVLLNLLDNLENVPQEIIGLLDKLDGPFAFCYKRENDFFLVRDLIGIKPLFYFFDERTNKFCFASEKKALSFLNVEILELNPTEILHFNYKTGILIKIKRPFFSLGSVHQESYEQLKKQTKELLIKAVKKRVPENQKLGLLFSGGIDSTFIAYVLRELKVDFTCYTAKFLGGNIEEAEDLVYAKRIAKEYNLNLKVAEVSTEELENYIVEVIKLIESRNCIKVSVALPFYIACKLAQKDNIRVMMTGIGSEEIFAGYKRHKKADDANQECVEGLKMLHERDLYRDDVVCMGCNQEERVPFLDNDLIRFAINIPVKYKLDIPNDRSKIILRDIALDMKMNPDYADRQKKAAQYGSKSDKGILRLAKDKGMLRQDYLNSLDIPEVELDFWKR